MSASSWRHRMREARAQDPDATARLLDELGTEEREAAEIEAVHRTSRLGAMQEYQPGAPLREELRLRLSGPEAAGTPIEPEVTGLSRGSPAVHAPGHIDAA
ncbi:hypothetical protein ACIRD8_26895 [Streptomyces sp. NPDC102451]|uniref:hypothetical protein n=1 Tax=Streptomyces sp. NPDC102451 TaxID=3366177 RepID=UPI00380EA7B9